MKIKSLFSGWSKKKTVIVSIFLSAALLLSVLIGVLNITVTANTSGKDYSVDNIVSHIYTISREEHSTANPESADKVKNYISSVLYGYGIENKIITHRKRHLYDEKLDSVTLYSPENIYAEIAGDSGTNILLVAHYDSCPYKIKYGEPSEGSHGAIDDGYGVSVLLEIARLYADAGLKNGIKFAFVDAEEDGLLGSYALVEEYKDWLGDVGLVVNVESRGETGPVYLFQTSENNSKLIEFYKNAGFPYTFSVASEIYDIMPNDTDLSPFLENGFAGLNVASLDGIKNYHNSGDVFENIDDRTLAKYCDTLLPLLDEFTLNEKYSDVSYFECSENSLFFTLFPNVLVSYGEVTGWVFFGIALALVAALCVVLILKKKIRITKVLISLALDIGLLAVICGTGFIVALLSCAICGVNYHFMFVIAVSADAGLLVFLSVIAIAAVIITTFVKRKLHINYAEMTSGALIFNGVMSIVCAAVLFGGTFIFVIPALLTALSGFLSLIKNAKVKTCLVGAVIAVAMLFTFSFYISLIYSVYISLTFGALGVLLMLAAVPFLLLVPPAFGFYDEKELVPLAGEGV